MWTAEYMAKQSLANNTDIPRDAAKEALAGLLCQR